MTTWRELIDSKNESIRRAGRWRSIRALDHGRPNTVVTATGTPCTSFASNDYLGLSQHPDVVASARSALERYGAGAGSARLVVGSRPVHHQLEDEVADWCGREAALLFPTGYQANVGVICALAGAARSRDGDRGPEQRPTVFSDELNHASIIDGCRLSAARVVVYRHRDHDHLAELLEANGTAPSLVVTDSVFSMDGDLAPLDELARLCEHHDALLVVDEAHAVLAPPPPPQAIVVGTLSKTLGAVGGFVAADRAVIDLFVNTSRSFIFTTAGAPADAAAALTALRLLRSDDGAELVERLRHNVEILVAGHPSPIVPIVVGAEDRALELSEQLAQRSLLVPAIRPPTVAPGTSRLRVALSAAHNPTEVESLRDALIELGARAA